LAKEVAFSACLTLKSPYHDGKIGFFFPEQTISWCD